MVPMHHLPCRSLPFLPPSLSLLAVLLAIQMLLPSLPVPPPPVKVNVINVPLILPDSSKVPVPPITWCERATKTVMSCYGRLVQGEGTATHICLSL